MYTVCVHCVPECCEGYLPESCEEYEGSYLAIAVCYS